MVKSGKVGCGFKFKRILIVTGFTIIAKLTFMNIGVTSSASGNIFSLKFLKICRTSIPVIVAFFAIKIFMFSYKLIAGDSVIKASGWSYFLK